VEDDNIVCLTVSRVLGFEFPEATVYSAENGQAGLEQFKLHSPEIVITDINMPVMNGLEMASEMKALRPDTKFIVVTGHYDKEHLARFSEIGYVEYLVKPLDFKKLFAVIKAYRSGMRGESKGRMAAL
jgi:YesN/AraC family two-component response regulator